MRLTVRDDFARYVIECPDSYGLKIGHKGFDYLIVPDLDDPEHPFWLFDELLIDAARSEEFGMKLISEEPLALIVGQRRGVA
jgi:hypothetical protein